MMRNKLEHSPILPTFFRQNSHELHRQGHVCISRDWVAGNHQEFPEPQGISKHQTWNSQKAGDFQSFSPLKISSLGISTRTTEIWYWSHAPSNTTPGRGCEEQLLIYRHIMGWFLFLQITSLMKENYLVVFFFFNSASAFFFFFFFFFLFLLKWKDENFSFLLTFQKCQEHQHLFRSKMPPFINLITQKRDFPE